jgi:ATP-binding cassette subfamily F protein 3
MVLVECRSVTFSYPGSEGPLFTSLNLSLSHKSRVGVVGENGAGKTTLLGLLSGRLAPGSGEVYRKAGLVAGYLPQREEAAPEVSLADYLLSFNPAFTALREEIAREAGAEKITKALARYDEPGGYEAETRMLLSRMGFPPCAEEKPFAGLSGGEKTRAGLARIFLQKPDVLFLDEPTNHLDTGARVWLEDFLASCGLAYVIVSHDRRFLDAAVSTIWEIGDRGLREYSGNYSFYREQKDIAYRRETGAWEQSRRVIARLESAAAERKSMARRMENFKLSRSVSNKGAVCRRDEGSGSGRARPGSAMRSATIIEKRLRELAASEEAKAPEKPLRREVRIDRPKGGNKRLLCVEDLAAGYEGKALFQGLSFSVLRGERLAVTGKNGSGKTTLFRVLAGELAPLRGKALIPPSAVFSWLTQELENLDPRTTLLETVMAGRTDRQTKARRIFADFGITGDSVFRQAGLCSIGERTKTAIVRALFAEPDLFILDEPTNHLEPESVEAFENALGLFPGGVIFASHDREFVERLATARLDMEEFLAE